VIKDVIEIVIVALNERNERRTKILSYLMTKLSGAGFSIFIFFIATLFLTDFDMYEAVKNIANPFIWLVFYGYGIVCSLFIDLLVFKIPKINTTIKVILYILAGYIIFIPWGWLALIAGTVGALCSLLFYLGMYLSQRKMVFKYGFAIMAPFILVILMNLDFTIKMKWEETKGDLSYTARFSYFNGEHAIPIHAKKGQTITFAVQFNNINEGGYGYHVLNEENELVGMNEVDEQKRRIEVKDSGIYRIIVTGDGLKGSFQVVWDVEE
jgi:hypothetical protein